MNKRYLFLSYIFRFFSILTIITGLTFSQNVKAMTSANSCQALFSHQNTIPKTIQNYLKQNPFIKNARGYSIIISVMLFSAATSSYISSKIATDYPFMTYFISQISILGIVVIGAPIWEPLSSYFRNLAFRLNKENKTFEQNVQSKYLEDLWQTTQKEFSINSQMSRNVIASVLNNIQINLFQSHMAFQKGDYPYAILQIATMAVRLRTLYSEIAPDDFQVTLAFQSILKYELKKHPKIFSDTWLEIKKLDSHFNQNKNYYQKLLNEWLK